MSETPRFTPAHRARLEVMLDENETTELPEQKAIRAALAEIDRLQREQQQIMKLPRRIEAISGQWFSYVKLDDVMAILGIPDAAGEPERTP